MLWRRLAEIHERYGLPPDPLHELIDGAVWDLEERTVADTDDLLAYAGLVAGSVGAMMLPFLVDDRAEIAPLEPTARALGQAMQITNILRDVGEDLEQLGRLYLPREALDRFGLTRADLLGVRPHDDVPGARRYVAAHRPCVLILDLNMPGISGFEILHSVRADPELPGNRQHLLLQGTIAEGEGDIDRGLDLLAEAARMEDALTAAKLNARMLLQVHDELVFEVPAAEVAATLPLVTKVMTDAPLPAVSLSVPLHVDAKAADNWDEAH